MLMVLRIEHRAAHRTHQIAERRGLGELHSDRHHVHGVPDQRVVADRLSGDRHADDDVVLLRQPLEQRAKAGQHAGEEARSLARGRLAHGADKRRRQHDVLALGVVRPQRGARTICRQLQNRKLTAEAIEPVLLIGDDVARRTQRLLFGVLDEILRGRQRLAGDAEVVVVQRGELGDDDASRPPIADDVVRDDDKRVVVVGAAHQLEANERPLLERERHIHDATKQGVHVCLVIRLGRMTTSRARGARPVRRPRPGRTGRRR